MKKKITASVLSLYSYLSKEAVFRWFILLLYIIILTINLSHHEMWRDELDQWLAARDSMNFSQLLSNIYYVGHPYLWYFGLFLLNKVTHNPVALQIFNGTLSVLAAFIFLKYSPFSKLQRLLFIFGYYFIYEYSTISRCYMLGILFLFMFIAVLQSKNTHRFLLLLITLNLLVQTNMYEIIIAVLLFFYMGIEYFKDNKLKNLNFSQKAKIIAGTLSFLANLFICLKVLSQSEDPRYTNAMSIFSLNTERLGKALSMGWQSFVPIPDFTYHFWNTNILADGNIKYFLSLGIIFISASLLWKTKKIFIVYCTGILTMLVFIYMSYPNYVRHYGHMFLLFMACLWLMHIEINKNGIKTRPFIKKCQNGFIMLILTSQIVAGIYASAMDFKYPFSQSREVAEYIKKQGLEDVPRVGIIDYAITPIMAYLKGSTYFFQGARFGTFTLFDKRRLEVMGTIPQYMLKGSILYIFTDNIQLEDSKIIKLKEFKDSIVEDETYYLYLKPAG